MSSYLTYYIAWTVLAYAVRQPALLVGILVFLVLRPYIPDPTALWRALSRASSLKHQVSVNAANVTVRRDLALIYLDLRRPKAALALLEEALARDPNDPDLLFMQGLALHRSGRNEEALAPLVRSVEHRAIRYGQPFMVAGDALLALGRTDEAIDAYERYAKINHSDVGVHVQLAKAHAQRSDREAVRTAISQAMVTWSQIPGELSGRRDRTTRTRARCVATLSTDGGHGGNGGPSSHADRFGDAREGIHTQSNRGDAHGATERGFEITTTALKNHLRRAKASGIASNPAN